MTLWQALGLGSLQGVTEFLPVSSSGHLVIGQTLLGLRIPGVGFEVLLHLATLLSVLVVYRQRILGLTLGVTIAQRREDFRYVGLLLIATIPAALLGVFFGDALAVLFESPPVVGFALLCTGGLLFSTRWALKRPSAAELGVAAAIIIGCAQALALVPGLSRSGTTVVAALWLGIAPLEAAAFSFLMSIPAIAGAGLLQLGGLASGVEGLTLEAAVVGFVSAAVSGILAIWIFVALLRNRSFPVFAWYCWGAGLLFLSWIGVA